MNTHSHFQRPTKETSFTTEHLASLYGTRYRIVELAAAIHCDAVLDTPVYWPNNEKFVQRGNDLGERMMNAFDDSFNKGYKRVIGVGSDLPDLSAEIMTQGIEQLKENDTVFGPSEDGGYYLIGMTKLIPQIFENKAWSTESLLDDTQIELKELGYSIELLQTLNDVDTIEDLRNSSIAERFSELM